MDTRNGEIIDYAESLRVHFPDRKYFKSMHLQPTEAQMNRRPPKIGRNEPCPCGSGKKFKKCCLNSIP